MLSQYVHTAARLGNAAICTTHLTRALHNYNVTPKVTQTSYSAAAAGLSRIMGVPQLHAFCHFNTKERKKNTHTYSSLWQKKRGKKGKGTSKWPVFPRDPRLLHHRCEASFYRHVSLLLPGSGTSDHQAMTVRIRLSAPDSVHYY